MVQFTDKFTIIFQSKKGSDNFFFRETNVLLIFPKKTNSANFAFC